jgi:hypothetical protein
MMFATCAKVGCNKQIEYDPDAEKFRPRYCPTHMNHDILTDRANAFWIATNAGKPTIQNQIVKKYVELRCPLCKLRITIPDSKTGYSQTCKTYGCEGTMIYHKDVEKENV